MWSVWPFELSELRIVQACTSISCTAETN